MKPLIGITVNYDIKDEIGMVTHFGTVGQQWNYIASDYVDAVVKAGGIPVLIPVYGDAEVTRSVTERLDGLLISGGNDVDPRRFGVRAKSYCGGICVPRDEQELELARYVIEETNIPVLGICRGIQVMNIAMGGTVYQDLEKEGGFEMHSAEMYPRTAVVHEVMLSEGSMLRSVLGEETIGVNSYHHQAVKETGCGFVVTGKAVEDDVIEVMELPGERFVVGVQWHPEMMVNSPEQRKIFEAFVAACKNK
ncbi:MAG: gamma-glutamyl-gamma-aminobutyrate hydrolase family protein [Firmicutes bacterium]|nr:gamma-glutamyl-gamma-aminobutyrate hydrolase family protein [Bacillota bacterium]